ncbi:MAG: autoinducer binding domain-containing protein [Pseudomonadota bacterium]
MIGSSEKIRDYAFAEIANAGFYIAFRLEFLLPEFEHNTLPLPWVHRYTQQGLLMLDPVMRWIYTNTGAIRWSEIPIPDSDGVLELAQGYGLNYGAAISLRDAEDPSVRSFGNFCRGDRELECREIEELTQKLELLFADLTAPSDVTEAELEVLRDIQNGKLIKEIAYSLGISEGAVKQRLRSAKDKLGARTTPQAVSVASSYGLI